MPGLRGSPAVTMNEVRAAACRAARSVPTTRAPKPSIARHLVQVERDALRPALHDVDQHDLARQVLRAQRCAAVMPT